MDLSGKLPGRGAYLHPSSDCWEARSAGNRIQQALRTKLSEEDRRALVEFMQSLPAEETPSEEGRCGFKERTGVV